MVMPRTCPRASAGLIAGTALVVAAVAWIGSLPPHACLAADTPPPSNGPHTSPAATAHDLQVRYAQARLRVAELDLARAIAANDTVGNAIGDREVERLRNHVAMLRRQVEIAREHPRTAARQASIAAAEAACADARADLEAAERANHRTAGSVSDTNLERLRAKVDLADVRLELCTSPEYELSLLAELEWNVEQLTDEVIDLRHKVDTGAKKDGGQVP